MAALPDEEADVDAELSAYLTGAQAVPVPTYFVGSFGAGSRRAMAALAASSAMDITYLGRRSPPNLAEAICERCFAKLFCTCSLYPDAFVISTMVKCGQTLIASVVVQVLCVLL